MEQPDRVFGRVAGRWVHRTGLAGMMFLALLLAGCSDGASELPAAERMPVQAAPVEHADHYAVTRYFSGEIESGRRSALAFEFSGRVAEVVVEEGDRVDAGDLLARLDTRLLEAEKRQAQASLEQRRSQLALARQTRARLEKLLGQSAVSQQEVDEAREQVRSLQAGVALDQARLETILTRLDKSRLVAPFDGEVARRQVDEGAVVGPEQAIVELVEAGRREARIAVAASFADRLEPDTWLDVEVEGRAERARILRVLPVRDPVTQTVDVVLALEGAPARYRPGGLVTAELDQRVETPGFWLPHSALTEGLRGLWAVYRLEPAGEGVFKVARHTVEVLHQNRDSVFARGTLEPGDRVLTSGVHRVVPGQEVRLTNPELAGRQQ